MLRTVIVGCNGQIGRAILNAAIARGDHVFAIDRTAPDGWPETAKGYATGDLSDSGEVSRIMDDAFALLGGLDVVINASGVLTDGTVMNTSDEDFRRVLETNLFGAFYLTRHAARHMSAENSGSILHISSMHGSRGVERRVAYAASKGGLEAMIRASAADLGTSGVTINAVAPGPVGKGMRPQAQIDPDAPPRRVGYAIPLNRVAEATEIAAAAMFLTGPTGRYITGHILPLDGGITATIRADWGDEAASRMRPKG